MEDSENIKPCRLYGVKNYSLWHFVDTQPIVQPRLRMHFTYTHFRKHGFFCRLTVQISVASSIALFRSLSFGLRHHEVIAFSASKAMSVVAEQRGFVGISHHTGKNALKYMLLYFSKLEFQQMRHTFPVRLQQFFILFG